MHPAGPLNINFTAIFIGQGTLLTSLRISTSGSADSLDSRPQSAGAPVFIFSPLLAQVPRSPSPSPQATISPQQKQQTLEKQPTKFHTKIAQAAHTTYLWPRLTLPAPSPHWQHPAIPSHCSAMFFSPPKAPPQPSFPFPSHSCGAATAAVSSSPHVNLHFGR